MKFNQWFKLNHQWVDIGKKVKIGKYNCTLYWDAEKRHWRVELEDYGNVGRSQLGADQAIRDAMTTLGVVKEDITIPINVGDVVLGGKFKNKRITVKEIGKNEKGDITINGRPLLKYRIIPQEIEEADMGVIYGQGMERGSGPKSRNTRAFLEKGPINSSGFANSVDSYYDRLDPRNDKRVKKPGKWLTMNKRVVG